MKRIFMMLLACVMIAGPAHAIVTLDVFRDGYVDDLVFDQNEFLDGVPDQINDTNAILAGTAEIFDQFNSIKFDAHGIMTYDIGPYQGLELVQADLYGFGYATGTSYAQGDPIEASFYSYTGDGIVGFDDFDSPADLSGMFDFYSLPGIDYSSEVQATTFSVDVTDSIKNYFNGSNSYLEFRVEAEDIEVYISAGEIGGTLVNTDFNNDGVRYGPRLNLTFKEQSTAAVPEPATLALLGTGLLGAYIRRRAGR